METALPREYLASGVANCSLSANIFVSCAKSGTGVGETLILDGPVLGARSARISFCGHICTGIMIHILTYEAKLFRFSSTIHLATYDIESYLALGCQTVLRSPP